MELQCRKCPGACCRYFSFPIDRPETYEDFEQIRWYLLHRGISVYIDADGDWCIIVRNLCKMLRKTPAGWRCKDYAGRPWVCREFSPKTCDFTRGGIEYEEFFSTPGEIEAYARRMLGDWVFEEKKKKRPPQRTRSARRTQRKTVRQRETRRTK